MDLEPPQPGEVPDDPGRAQPGAPLVGEGRHQALELRDAAEAAFESGDYRRARALDQQLEALVGRAAPAREGQAAELAAGAGRDRRQLGLDPVAVAVGLAATLLYGLGWLVALW